ncbi:MAG TPA: hypothetical protein VKW04_14795 [Planctomycetota bacterium]|nr:hypothetical protein [Planctomycetota bacterium]
MKHALVATLVLLAGCGTSGPPAPPLPAPITLTLPDYEEKGGILPVVGTLTVTVTPEGEASSICRRQILTDVERRGELSNSERWELHTRAEAWAAKAGDELAPPGKTFGSLIYGAHKATWEKGASLSPELDLLVHYLKELSLSLSVVRKRG